MKFPLFSAKKKNKDYMLLLVTDPSFRKEVAKLREEFNIPLRGFKEYSTEAAEWGQTERIMRAKEFAKEMRRIVSDYSLPDNFGRFVEKHILYGTADAPLRNFAVIPFSRETDPSESRHVKVEIYARLTKEEIKELREEVDRIGGDLPDFRELKDLEKRLEREKEALEVQDLNANRLNEGDSRMTYGEALGDKYGKRKEGEKAREDLRGLEDHRVKRFGKK